MGAVLSVFGSRKEKDYEKILSDLDDKIKKLELRLSETKLRQRKYTIIFLIYSLFTYSLYLVAFFGYLKKLASVSENWMIFFLPMVAGPVLIHSIRALLNGYFKRRITNQEAKLDSLRKEQILKLEELKKKTAYYKTKNLLDRYESGSLSQGRTMSLTAGKPTEVSPKIMPPISVPRQRVSVRAQNVSRQTLNSAPTSPTMGGKVRVSLHKQVSPIPFTPSGFGIPEQRKWYDKLVDVIVGDEGPETKYALICQNCSTHNGLVLPSEIETVEHFCPKCNHFNPSRRKNTEKSKTADLTGNHNPRIANTSPSTNDVQSVAPQDSKVTTAKIGDNLENESNVFPNDIPLPEDTASDFPEKGDNFLQIPLKENDTPARIAKRKSSHIDQ